MFASRNAALSAAIIALAAGAATAVDYTVTSISPEDYSETFVTAAAGPSQVGYGSGPSTGGNSHAILWSGTAESLIDLNPDGYDGSVIYGVGGGQQVGVGFDLGTNLAILWPAPTAGSAVNLTPAGIDFAAAYGTDGTTQAGSGRGSLTLGSGHALAWTGTAESVVDLHPIGYSESTASFVRGGRIVGVAITFEEIYTAALWTSASPDSFISLHPEEGFFETVATTVEGLTVAGYGNGAFTDDVNHALLWPNEGESYIDLHPAGYLSSFILAMSGQTQVGTASINESEHAMVWTGTAASAVDLHSLLPAAFSNSRAVGIGEDGSIYVQAYDLNGLYRSFRFTPVTGGLCASCAADYDQSGGVDGSDVEAFFVEWAAGTNCADVNLDGGVDGSDVESFFVPWQAGGC